MSKELFVTSTPHETKLAVVEDDQVVEVFFERENEYTLAGSIYKGRITRVLPGMQSAFVDIGLERDAFLYVTDFLEEVEDHDDLDTVATPAAPAKGGNEQRGHRGRRPEQHRAANAAALQRPIEEATTEETQVEHEVEAEPLAAEAASTGEAQSADATPETDRVPRRWRGRRGRRRGRGGLSESKFAVPSEAPAPLEYEEVADFARNQHETEQPESEQLEHLGAQVSPEEDHEETAASTAVHEPEARQERAQEQQKPQHKPQQQKPQRILLPGESLAKYNPKPESAVASKAK